MYSKILAGKNYQSNRVVFDGWQTLALAVIQGFSEFLPISSSAHLILPSLLLGWKDQGLMFDVAVHMGTLVAVVVYFWRDLLALIGDILPQARPTVGGTPRELWRLVAATLPVLVAGLLLNGFIESTLRVLPVIATTTLLFGILLGWSHYHSRHKLIESGGSYTVGDSVRLRHAVIIGVAQILALVPGTSRSGITITVGLFLGYSPAVAARFSFLLSVPVILGAMLFLALELASGIEARVPLMQMLVAATVAAISAYATIALFLAALNRMGLMPFVYYRLLLGIGLFAVIGFGG